VPSVEGMVALFARRTVRIGSRMARAISDQLFCSVVFEKFASFFEGEGVSVDLEFVFAGVFRDRDDMADSVAVLAEGLDDEIDVYHG
jgi:hypothetical protein